MSTRIMIVMLLSSGALPALAQSEEEQPAGEQAQAEEEDEPTGPPDIARREIPRYDGRDPAAPNAGETALWIPRVIFFPLYALLEYVVRRPVAWLLTKAEQERWHFLQLPGSNRTDPSWGIVPTFFADFGFRPHGGLYLWMSNVLAPRNNIRAQVGFGGVDWLRGTLADQYSFSDRIVFESYFDAWQRPDYLYLGLGPNASPARVARYGRAYIEGRAAMTLRPWRSSYFRVQARITTNKFYDTTYLDTQNELSLTSAVAAGWFDAPPGFEGYSAYVQRLEAAFDTREDAPASETGIRLQVHGDIGFDLYRPQSRSWFLGGAALGLFWDVSAGRTLALWSVVESSAALGTEPVPFTELPDIGYRGRMTAFRRAWLTGPSATSLSLEYRWPIWVSIAGLASVSVGNAFGPDFQGFGIDQMRMSFAVGLRTTNDADNAFTLQVGLGTDTFAAGLSPVIVRLTAGVQEGF
jgi:hypothetical protein